LRQKDRKFDPALFARLAAGDGLALIQRCRAFASSLDFYANSAIAQTELLLDDCNQQPSSILKILVGRILGSIQRAEYQLLSTREITQIKKGIQIAIVKNRHCFV
jgi:hypothetical protein